MVNYCVVSSCGTSSRSCQRSKVQLSFHVFPKCPELRAAWMKEIGLTKEDLKPNSRVCSLHFNRNDFVQGVKSKLKTNSVPTIFKNSCAIAGCSMVETPESLLKFFRFPVYDTNSLQKWIAATKQTDFVPTPNSYICSSHFSVLQWKDGNFLKEHAFPDILLKQEEDIEFSTSDDLDVKTNNIFEVTLDYIEPIPDVTSIDTNNDPCTPRKNYEISETRVTPANKELLLSPKSTPTKQRLRREIKILQQRLARRDKKISTMKNLIHSLQKKNHKN